MSTLSGYTRTGRVQLGPASDLVEYQAKDGSRYTAVVFHPEYRSHNAINAALNVVLSFLESPMVAGLSDLHAYELGESTFIYKTGQAWSIAECIRTLSDLGESGGVRAGVELMLKAGEILIEAAETGEMAGVYSHGGLTPWRLMLDAEGRVQIVGHALPQVEILTFHEQPDRVPREDAFRYCPPERMESRKENFSSDLFGLALVAFEVMTGKPVYDGLVNDIRAKAARGETSRRIHQFREYLPDSVRQILTTVLRPDFRDRYHSGSDYLEAVQGCLDDPEVQGPSLRDMMYRVSRHQPRAKQDLDPGKTSMLSKDELKKMMDDEDAPAPGKPARATFAAPPRRAEPVAAPPPERAAPPSAPAAGAVAGPPPARRPPPRTGIAEPEVYAGPTAVPSPAEQEPPRFGPPSRSGVRPNPRAAGEVPQAAPPPQPAAPPPPAAAPAEPTRPSMGVARLPPSRRAPGADGGEPEPVRAAPEPARPTPPQAPPPVERAVPPPPAVTSGNKAADLLARVKASGNSGAFPRPQPTPSASQVVDRILTSSGSGAQALRERVARAVQESTGAFPRGAEEATGARAIPAPPVVTPPAPPPAPPPQVAAPPPAPPPQVAAPPPQAVAPPPAPPPQAAAPPIAAPQPSETAATPIASLVADAVADDPSRPRNRVPDAIRSSLKGEPVPFKLARGVGAPVQKRRIPGQSSLADVVGLLVGQAVPLRTTLDGRVAGWYRLGPAAGPLPADTRLDTLNAEDTLYFHFVESRTVVIDVEVVTADGTKFRMRAPVGTAVPVASLLDSVSSMLDLPAGDWTATLDGAALEPFHILEDRPVGPQSRLAVRKA